MRKSVNTHIFHGNDIGGSSCGAITSTENDLLQSRISRTADNANGQGTADEENAESSVDHFERGFDVDTWASCFGGDDGNVLGTNDGEDCGRETSQKTLEAAQIASREILAKGTAMFPVGEAVSVVLWVAADHGDEGEEEERKDQNDLAAGQPELRFTICPHR